MLQHPLAFGDRKLAQQEETFARSGGDPVGVAAAGVQECRLRRSGGLLGKLDQFVFNLERSNVSNLRSFTRSMIFHLSETSRQKHDSDHAPDRKKCITYSVSHCIS